MYINFETFYDPIRDISQVALFGCVDLNDALATGSVPSQLATSTGIYNDIDNADTISSQSPDDNFSALRALNNLRESNTKD